MEKKIIDLEIKHNTQSLKAQLVAAQKEVQILSEKFGATSKEAIEAAKRAGELKDTIGDAKALTDAFNPDAKFNALSNSLGGVASGFSAFQGALGLVGVETKDLEKQLLKVQSAMAISQSLQQLGEARDSFKQLKAVVIDSFKGIKVAIGSTGIGLLLVALGTLYAYWDDIKAAVSGVSEEQKKLNASSQINLDIQKEKLTAVDSQDNILKLQGKTEREILNLKIAQTNEVIKATKQQLLNNEKTALAQIEASQRNKEILSGTLQFLSYPLSLLLKSIDQVGKLLGKDWDLDKKFFDGVAAFVFDPEETKKEIAAVKKETEKGLKELENSKAGYQLAIKAIDKTALEDAKTIREQAKENNKQIEEDNAKAKKELNDERLRLQKEQFDKEDAQFKLHQEATYTEQELEIARLVEQYDAKFAIANGNAELEKELEQAQKDEIAKINKTANDALTEAQKEKDAKDLAAAKEKTDKEIADAKTLQDRKVQMVRGSFDVLTGIADNLSKGNEADQRKAFKLNKAASLGQAIVNTGLAVTGALTAGGNALKIAGGINFVEAALVGTIGALNIAKIAGTQFDSGGGGGGGGATATAPQIPRFDIIASNPQTQLAQLDKQPIQAYVVSGEVTTAQNLERNRVRNATF